MTLSNALLFEKEPRKNVPLSELSDNDILYQLESTLTLAAGYDSMSTASGETVVSNPRDRFSTNIQLPHYTIFSVVSRDIELPEDNVSKGNMLTNLVGRFLPKKQNEITSLKSSTIKSYQIKSIINKEIVQGHANGVFSPNRLPEKYKNFIEDGENHILEEDLVIFPDYSNLSTSSEKEGILLTPEMFGYKIYKGSEVMFREGGGDGNLVVKVFNGKIIVNTGHKVIPYVSEFQSANEAVNKQMKELDSGIEEM